MSDQLHDRGSDTSLDRVRPMGRAGGRRPRGLWGAAGALVLLGLGAFVLGPVSARRAEASAPTPATITVTGTGQLNLPPTEANVVLGTQVQAGSAETALSEEGTRMNRILAALARVPVPRSDIETQGYSIEPDQNQSGNVTGFTVNDTLSITLTKPSLVALVLDRAVAAGANQVQGVNFTGPGSSDGERRAEALALSNAHAQAMAAAAHLGMTVGAVRSVNLEPSSGPAVMMGAFYHAALTAAPAIVPPSSVTVSSTVDVTYALVP